MKQELKELLESETDLKKREMRKIAELKDSYLATRRRIGSEQIFITR